MASPYGVVWFEGQLSEFYLATVLLPVGFRAVSTPAPVMQQLPAFRCVTRRRV